MKKNKLEMLVLVLGLLVIGTAVFFIFIRPKTEESIFVTNLIISFGFLIYVLYTIMSTGNLNREIRHLNRHVESLKTEIAKKEQLLQERKARIDLLEKDVEEKDQLIKAAEEKIAHLEQRIEELSAPPEAGQNF